MTIRAARAHRATWASSSSLDAEPASLASGSPGAARLGTASSESALLGLQATAGNAAVSHLVARPSTHHGDVISGPAIQRADGDVPDTATGVGGDVTSLSGGGGGGGGASSTTIGPPTRSTYAVSGSLQDAANSVSARTEAGSETSSPSLDTVTDGGRIITATVTVAQSIELPSWSDRASGTSTQQAEWDRFSAAISAHEDGHVAKDVAAWTGAHKKIAGQTEADGNAAFDAISKAADQANTDYDTATQHGITQGTGIDPNV